MESYFSFLDGKRALSRSQIFETGFPYADFNNKVDEGTYTGILVMKEWGKKPCLHCYFILEDGQKIVLTAYFKDSLYKPGISKIDFSDLNIKAGSKFLISTEINSKGKTSWHNAELLK